MGRDRGRYARIPGHRAPMATDHLGHSAPDVEGNVRPWSDFGMVHIRVDGYVVFSELLVQVANDLLDVGAKLIPSGVPNFVVRRRGDRPLLHESWRRERVGHRIPDVIRLVRIFIDRLRRVGGHVNDPATLAVQPQALVIDAPRVAVHVHPGNTADAELPAVFLDAAKRRVPIIPVALHVVLVALEGRGKRIVRVILRPRGGPYHVQPIVGESAAGDAAVPESIGGIHTYRVVIDAVLDRLDEGGKRAVGRGEVTVWGVIPLEIHP